MPKSDNYYYYQNDPCIKIFGKHFVNPFENNIFAVEMSEGKQEIPLPFLFNRNKYDRKERNYPTR